MQFLIAIPLPLRLAALFAIGTCLGSLVNWAIYRLAWNPRDISPWSLPPKNASPRRPFDRFPVVGWFGLQRESAIHGPWFWMRPMLLEIGLGLALAALYWWEVDQLGLVRSQLPAMLVVPLGPLHLQFLSHALLLCWMLVASFIDIDEKIIPDEVTVTGTLLGLVLATCLPMSLLPEVAERAAVPVVGEALYSPTDGPGLGPQGGMMWLEPVTAMSPHAWDSMWGNLISWQGLAVALACYGLWCFALAPRIWRGRRGPLFALRLIAARVGRELCRPPLAILAIGGLLAILLAWAMSVNWWNGGDARWAGLLTSLIGLVASGGIVWAVRLIGTAALRREAMGFGDVTLMMMIGTFLGWQACLMIFFLAPFAALLVGILQFVLHREDEIPYGPFLCLATAGVVVAWAPIWNWAEPIFAFRGLVPLVLVICLVLLGLLLAIWQKIKMALFSSRAC